MSRPKSVRSVRPDKMAVVCAWCPDKAAGDDWAESRGYEITHGICPECRAKYNADSLRGSELDLAPLIPGAQGIR